MLSKSLTNISHRKQRFESLPQIEMVKDDRDIVTSKYIPSTEWDIVRVKKDLMKKNRVLKKTTMPKIAVKALMKMLGEEIFTTESKLFKIYKESN